MAIDFPGTSDNEVDVGDPSSLQLTGACAIMCWVICDILQNKDIVAKQTSSDRGWSLQTDEDVSDSVPAFTIAKTSSTTMNSGWPTTYMENGKLYFIAGQFNPSTSVEIWVQGIKENENTTDVPATMYNSGNTIVIGGRPDPIGNFDGIIDDVRIYNRNLSAAEMATIFAARGHDAIVDGLVSRWLMNEKAPGATASGASSIKDIGPGGNHGSPVGTVTYAESQLSIMR
jgi:hypothetical protein